MAEKITSGKVLNALYLLFLAMLPLSIAGAQAFLGSALLIWIYRLIRCGFKEVTRTPVDLPLLCLAVIFLISSLWNGTPAAGLDEIRSLWTVAAFYLLLHAVDVSSEKLLYFIGISSAAAGLLGILQNFQNRRLPELIKARFNDRPEGTFSHALTFGAFQLFVFALFFSMAMLKKNPVRYRIFLYAIIFITALSSLFSRGRSVMIAFGAVLLILSLLRSWKTAAAAVAVLLVLAGSFFLFDSSVRSRVEDALELEADGTGSAGSRLIIWREALEVAVHNPVLGVGPGNFRGILTRRTEGITLKSRSHAHNSYLQILVESGTAGLIAFLWLWTALAWAGIKEFMQYEDALIAGDLAAITAFLIIGLFEYNFGDSEIMMLVWFIAGLMMRRGMRPKNHAITQ